MTATAVAHPAWCDPDLCTADPAAPSLAGYRAGTGGQHRSASIPLDLRCAIWLPEQDATAYLTEAVAPWACEPFLRVRLGDAELSMAVDDAGQVLAALSALVASVRGGEVDW